MRIRIALAIALLASFSAQAQMRVLASNGIKAVVDELRPQYEKKSGHALSIDFGTSASLKQRIESGESFDVTILTSDLIDELAKSGKIASGTTAGLARAGIGVGVRAGTAKPNIATPDALKQTLMQAKSVTYARDGASRIFIGQMLDHLGIAKEVDAKTIYEQGSVRAAAKVADGQAELLMTLVPEILPAPGVDLVGPLPAQLQHYISFAAGVGAKAGHADAAKALIKYLAAPENAPTLKAKGMEPI
jgi:molybdate transport system substrate-binding protein